MELGSKRGAFPTLIIVTLLFFSASTIVSAAPESSRPADLVSNEKVIYALPDAGSITPDNPLFFIKKVRDDILLAIPQDKESKTKLMIQISDKYTVYADMMQRNSKSDKAVLMFESSFKLQESVVDILKDAKKDRVFGEIRETAIQSNIKQAEIIRLLMDDVSPAEQSTLVQHLNTNMTLRKRLQGI